MKHALRPDGLLALALPMLVWALHFLFVYVLSGLACARGWERVMLMGASAVFWAQVGATLIALAGLALLAWRAWPLMRPPAGHGPAAVATARRGPFVARTRVVLATLAAIAVIYTAMPLFLLPTCDPA